MRAFSIPATPCHVLDGAHVPDRCYRGRRLQTKSALLSRFTSTAYSTRTATASTQLDYGNSGWIVQKARDDAKQWMPNCWQTLPLRAQPCEADDRGDSCRNGVGTSRTATEPTVAKELAEVLFSLEGVVARCAREGCPSKH